MNYKEQFSQNDWGSTTLTVSSLLHISFWSSCFKGHLVLKYFSLGRLPIHFHLWHRRLITPHCPERYVGARIPSH